MQNQGEGEDYIEDEENKNLMYLKIIIVGKPARTQLTLPGDSSAGKSCLLARYSRQEFDMNIPSTVGIEFAPKSIVRGDTIMKLNIMDTAGQEKFQSIGSFFFRNAVGAIFVFDLTNRESF